MKRLRWLMLVIYLSGCQSTHLLYVHNTSVGIDVAVSTAETARMSFGYDRDTYAIVPKVKDGAEAMSLTGASCVYTSPWGQRIQFAHLVATGVAAEQTANQMAASPAGVGVAAFAMMGTRGGTRCD